MEIKSALSSAGFFFCALKFAKKVLGVNAMDKEQLAKLVAEKLDAAYKASDHPKKFFITANGRGVTDGGELYNAVLADVLGVVKVALVEILQEAIPAPVKVLEKVAAPAKVQEKVPAAKPQDKPAKKK